jgi:hypothetical protein
VAGHATTYCQVPLVGSNKLCITGTAEAAIMKYGGLKYEIDGRLWLAKE